MKTGSRVLELLVNIPERQAAGYEVEGGERERALLLNNDLLVSLHSLNRSANLTLASTQLAPHRPTVLKVSLFSILPRCLLA